MRKINEGDYEDIRVSVDGTGLPTSPERRILTSTLGLVVGYDWAAATWDGTARELSALFDTRVAVLATPGFYYMELRCVIGAERKSKAVKIQVIEAGP
jgi:hypothetical protein